MNTKTQKNIFTVKISGHKIREKDNGKWIVGANNNKISQYALRRLAVSILRANNYDCGRDHGQGRWGYGKDNYISIKDNVLVVKTYGNCVSMFMMPNVKNPSTAKAALKLYKYLLNK